MGERGRQVVAVQIHTLVADYLRLGDDLIDAQLWSDFQHLAQRMTEATSQLQDAAFYCQIHYENRDR